MIFLLNARIFLGLILRRLFIQGKFLFAEFRYEQPGNLPTLGSHRFFRLIPAAMKKPSITGVNRPP